MNDGLAHSNHLHSNKTADEPIPFVLEQGFVSLVINYVHLLTTSDNGQSHGVPETARGPVSGRGLHDRRRATYYGDGRGQFIGAVSIRQRPAEVEDRAILGHWEGDLVEGSRGTYIATLVKRQSRFVIIVKVPDKRSDVVVASLIKAVRELLLALRRSLT